MRTSPPSLPYQNRRANVLGFARLGDFLARKDVAHLRDDILQCLEQANLAINGPNPSQRPTAPTGGIPCDLVIYISKLTRLCYEYALKWEDQAKFTEAERKLLRQTVWMIMQGWCLVVAGDFDNIASEVQLDGEIKEIL